MTDLTQGFSFGINVDDPWKYAGIIPPKSIVIPFLFSLNLPVGRVAEKIDQEIFVRHSHELPRTAAQRASLMLAENLQRIGVDFVRCWFPWRFFEKDAYPKEFLQKLYENSYEEWLMDTFVETLSSHGITVVPVIACGYHRMLPKGLNIDSDRELYLKRAFVHASLLVRRYKRFVRFWQIENEPNWWHMHSAGGWRKGISWLDPHGFRLKLLKELNLAVHAEDPNATTIINLEADSFEASSSEAKVCSKFSDMIGLDFYPNYGSSSPVNTSILKNASHIAKEIGASVIISETGYPSGPRIFGYSQAKQAEYVRRACETAYGLDQVNGIGIWRYSDSWWRSFPDQENHFGLFEKSGKPKAGWNAFERAIAMIKQRGNLIPA